MSTTCSLTDSTPSDDPILDLFLERLDQVLGESQIDALVAESAARHPERASEFRKLADGWCQLRGLRDPERLGPYRIRGVIAVGGMGKIYEAEEDELNRIVAVKTIKPGRTTDPQLLARFDRERKALAQLHHTHIVPIFATGQQQGLLYFAMPRIHGASLRGLIKTASGLGHNGTHHTPISSFEELLGEASTAEASDHASRIVAHSFVEPDPAPEQAPAPAGGPAAPAILPPDFREQAVRLMIEVAEAVHHAHQAAIIHRDLKPANILVERAPAEHTCHSWVLDFGLARFKTAPAEPRPADAAGAEPTSPESLNIGPVGTWVYMAPEQIEPRDDRPVDARTDVYALGATLYELLTFRRVVETHEQTGTAGGRFQRIRHQIVHEPPAPPSRLVPGFPRELEAVCLKALEKKPEDRYESAQSLADDLHRWLEGKPTKAGKAGPVTRLRMFVKRRRALSAAVAAVALLLLGASSSAVVLSRAETAASNAKTKQAVAELHVSEQKKAALQREQDLVALQRLWTSLRRNGWFDDVWGKVRILRGSGLDPQLQGQAAAALEGIDAKFIKTIPRAFQQVAIDPRANRLLLFGDRPTVAGRPTSLTALWDGATDTFVVEKDFGPGVIAFRDDGTPLQLSRDPDDPAALTLFDVATSQALHRFRSPREGPSALTAPSISRTGSHLAAVARPVRAEPGGPPVPEDEATTIAVWSAASGEPVCAIDHKATAQVVLSPDGRLLAAWDSGGEITVWLLPEGKELTHFRVSRAHVHCLAFGRDPVWRERPDPELPPWLLAVGDSGGLITVWDLFANRPRSICRGSSYEINALDFSPDGAFLASVGRGVNLWNVASGSHLLEIGAEGYQVQHTVAFSSDGRRLAIVNGPEFLNQPRVDLVELEQGRGIRTLYGLQGKLESVVVSPDGRLIAAVSNDWLVGIWDRASGQLRAVLEIPVGSYVDSVGMAFDADGRRFACSAGHQAKLWDLETHQVLGQWDLPEGLDDRPAFQGADRLMLLREETRSGKNPPFGPVRPVEDPRVCRLYDLLGPTPTTALKVITDFDQYVHQIEVAPDAAYFVVEGLGMVNGAPKRSVRILRGPEYEMLEPLSTKQPPGSPGHLLMDPLGQTLGLVLDDLHWTLLDLPSLRLRGEIDPPVLALGPGVTRWVGQHDLTANEPYMLVLYQGDPEQPLLRVVFDGPGGYPVRCSFTPDGQSVVWCKTDGTVSVCDLQAVNRHLSELGLGW